MLASASGRTKIVLCQSASSLFNAAQFLRRVAVFPLTNNVLSTLCPKTPQYLATVRLSSSVCTYASSVGTRFEAVREALADKNNVLTVKDLCELAGVSRSGYYNWIRSENARVLREAKDQEAFEKILEAYQFRGYAKGVRGIHMRLLHMGVLMNVKKIRRLMRKYRLVCPIRKPNPYRRLHKSIQMGNTAENLNLTGHAPSS